MNNFEFAGRNLVIKAEHSSAAVYRGLGRPALYTSTILGRPTSGGFGGMEYPTGTEGSGDPTPEKLADLSALNHCFTKSGDFK